MTNEQIQNLPPFISMEGSAVTYNPAEIEHRMYMFDHRAVGCVVIACTRQVREDGIGTAKLDGKVLPKGFYFQLEDASYGKCTLLIQPVRGFAYEYEKEYTLTLEDFQDVDGNMLPSSQIIVKTEPRRMQNPEYAAHDAVALEAAREGIVLLQNEGHVLPLKKGSMVNLFGEGVTNFRISATGAGRINPRAARSLREAVTECSDLRLNPDLDEFYRLPANVIPDAGMLMEAKGFSDTAVFVITRGTGENIDNRPIPGEYYLTESEENMIAAVSGVFEKTVAVLNVGYPIDMRWIKKYNVKAVIYAGLAGQAGADALVEILHGSVNPSGKLPDTWAWDYLDIPSGVNFYHPESGCPPILASDPRWVDTCYEEGIYVGYRYFESFGKDAAYCFGHGLSYTDFEITASDLRREEEKILIDVTVKNTGVHPGKEVVQAYVKLPGTLQEQPARQLAAFRKTKMLQPEESESFTLTIEKKRLGTYAESMEAWVIEQGDTRVFVGNSVRNAAYIGCVHTAEIEIIRKVRNHLPCPVEFEEISREPQKEQWPTGEHSGIVSGAECLTNRIPRRFPELKEIGEKAETLITYADLRKKPSLMDAFVSQMKTAELARLNVMYGHGWGMDGIGEAGRTPPLEKYGLPEIVCADGNCGVNVSRPNIGMPTSVTICASFNPGLAREVGRVIGEEALDNGINMILGTAMNIHRNPLNGRHPEYFSEDPYLAGIMAASQVQGLHQAGVFDSVKHVACNNCETARKRNHSLVKERTLREIYLRAFEVLLENVKPCTIMTAYNAINGAMCGSDPVLLEGIFREELGFDGFVMTDWESYETVEMTEAVKAGISWLTPGERDGSIVNVLVQAVADGKLSRAELERNARRVFSVLLRAGQDGWLKEA